MIRSVIWENVSGGSGQEGGKTGEILNQEMCCSLGRLGWGDCIRVLTTEMKKKRWVPRIP